MNSHLILAVVALAGAVSAKFYPECVCPRNYDPVCASNGVMFSNPCMLGCHNAEHNDHLVVVDQEQCQRSLNKDLCICTMEYMPVCGSDHVTYGNKCAFDCAAKKDSSLKKVGDFACEAATFQSLEQNDDLCVCTDEYMPLCGSDKVTYPNKCTFECAAKKTNGLKIVHSGRCAQEESALFASIQSVCTLEYAPVCGSNHVTYGNKCMFKYAASQDNSLTMLHTGECQQQNSALFGAIEQEDICICTREYMPVCGSDGVTYDNMCLLNCAAKKDKSLKMTKYDACESTDNVNLVEEDEPAFCTLEYAPVCGSDKVTYANKCLFKHAAKKNTSLKVLYNGMCDQDDAILFKGLQNQDDICICTREYMPVCGSDHVTYANECLFRCAAKQVNGLTILYHDSC